MSKMNYRPKERFILAWRWLPLEIVILITSILIGWGINQWLFKPVYQARVDLQITRHLKRQATSRQRQKQRRQDIADVAQFAVMPHKRAVLVTAGSYAYTHDGIWQSIQDLSESVQAVALKQRPVLRLTASSTSRAVAQANAAAFNVATKQELRTTLTHYQVKTISTKVTRTDNVMWMTVWKIVLVIGGSLAILSPYLVGYVRRGERDEDQTAY